MTKKTPRSRYRPRSTHGKGYDAFVLLCRAHFGPHVKVETEVVFAPPRKFRADYVLRHVDRLVRPVIVEREGGLFAKGRAGMAHAIPTSIRRDMEKANMAQLRGFLYLRYTPKQLESGEAVEALTAIFGGVPPGRAGQGPA